jgi:hypothetical protein
MGFFSKGDAAQSARIDEALAAQDTRDAACQAARTASADAYVKRHGLEKVVDKSVDRAMALYHDGFNTKGWD